VEQHELISHGLHTLAGEAGSTRIDVAEVARLVRRRRRLQSAAALTGCMALTASVLGGLALSPHARSAGMPVHPNPFAASGHTAPKYCGAPPRTSPLPQTSEPPRQPALLDTASRIEQLAGVTKGQVKPGTYSRWYGGVEIDNEWDKVIVYRVPGSGLDAAICTKISNVTVELRVGFRPATEAQRVGDRIRREVGLGRHRGFRLYTIQILPDGTVRLTSDHPDTALLALRGYGPGVVVDRGVPPTLFDAPQATAAVR
jgi:hypothetical protein